MQLFQGCLFGYTFCYASGASVLIGLPGPSFKMDFTMATSTFRLAINTDSEYFLKFNLFAVIVLVILIDILNETRNIRAIKIINSDELEKIDPIGELK
jgi:xanthine/uracil permease